MSFIDNWTMTMIEDVRKPFQDFLAPELRSLAAGLDAADQIASARHGEWMARFDSVDKRFDHLIEAFEFDKRIEKLESGAPSQKPLAKGFAPDQSATRSGAKRARA